MATWTRMALSASALIGLCGAAVASADEILFNNGDRLTGKIASVEGGKMKITTKVAGDVIVDVKDVKTFTTEGPVEIRTVDSPREKIVSPATGDQPGSVRVTPAGPAAPQVVPLDKIKYVNYSEDWTGSVVAGALFARGNTFADEVNIGFDVTRRTLDDRITFGGAYHFGRQKDPDTGDKRTTTDNWFLQGKYDYFFTERFYGFASLRYDHDRIAELDYRLLPAAGVGYQWIDRPDIKFDTEAGLAYICESFEDDTSNSAISAKLAYHYKHAWWEDKVQFFHNLEYYPSLERLDDYLILTDVGLRTAITTNMFAEYRFELRYDSTPAAGLHNTDLRHIVGVGWKF